MTDGLRFEPAEFTVRAGETVRFEVTSTGQIVHAFFIGDAEAQAAHATDMAAWK